MIILVNVLTVIAAIVIAFKLAYEAEKVLVSSVAILIGFWMHWDEARRSLEMGICQESAGFIVTVDACIDYSGGNMVEAQAFILGGSTVLIITLLRWLFPPLTHDQDS